MNPLHFLFYIIYKIQKKYQHYCFWNITPKEGIKKIKEQARRVGDNCKILGELHFRIDKGGEAEIGDNFYCQSGNLAGALPRHQMSKFIVCQGASLMIGNNVGVTNIVIVCWDNITIGNNVKIGTDCTIFDTNFHNIDADTRCSNDRRDGIITAPIAIKDNVFIGTRCIICKGVTIGENSIIAAGSVVVKDIPENEIWGGNPARFIKKINR